MNEGPKIRIVDLVFLGATNDVKKLIAAGFSVKEKDDFGNYPIVVAASRNDLETFEVLLNAGADTTVFNDDGRSAMTWAKAFNNEKMIALLDIAKSSHSTGPQGRPRVS